MGERPSTDQLVGETYIRSQATLPNLSGSRSTPYCFLDLAGHEWSQSFRSLD
jgi:hypothetical protein